MTRREDRRHRNGFSVIELLVALALLGVLATVAWPLAETVRQREKERELQRALWTLRDAIDAYKTASDALPATVSGATTSGYPPNLEALVTGLPDEKMPGGRRVFLRAIPRDPFSAADLPAPRTWALRTYASDATRPFPGDDVYDVRSMASGKALDGSWLNQW